MTLEEAYTSELDRSLCLADTYLVRGELDDAKIWFDIADLFAAQLGLPPVDRTDGARWIRLYARNPWLARRELARRQEEARNA